MVCKSCWNSANTRSALFRWLLDALFVCLWKVEYLVVLAIPYRTSGPGQRFQKSTIELSGGFSMARITTRHASRVALVRLFFCLESHKFVETPRWGISKGMGVAWLCELNFYTRTRSILCRWTQPFKSEALVSPDGMVTNSLMRIS